MNGLKIISIRFLIQGSPHLNLPNGVSFQLRSALVPSNQNLQSLRQSNLQIMSAKAPFGINIGCFCSSGMSACSNRPPTHNNTSELNIAPDPFNLFGESQALLIF